MTDIVVYGANGLVGRRVCAELEEAGASFAVAGRNRAALERLALPAAEIRSGELGAICEGARVVLNCAGPLAEVGEPVLATALAAGAHYVDLGGDQAFVHAMYEQHESTARHAGRVAAMGCAVNGALGDWAAAWAAAHVCGLDDDGAVVRDAPAPRIGEDRPLDEVAISYLFDDLVLSPTSQRAVFANLHARGLAWRRDRWDAVAPASERRRVNAGPATGGEREVTSFPGGEVITVPRHVHASSVQTFVSTTRDKIAGTALRLFARALPLIPKRATELLAPYTPGEDEYARTRFAVVAQARRGFQAAQVVVTGQDLYRASAMIAAWVARELSARAQGPLGMKAPSELFRPAAALRELESLGALAVEPGFG